MKNKKLLAWLAMFVTSLLCIVIYIFMTVEIVTREGSGWELDPGADSIGMLVGASLLVAFFLLVFTVFFHGLIGFLGKHKIEEINFKVLRAIRKNKKNRWVVVWAIFPAIPTALFLWEGITEKFVWEVILGLVALVYTYFYMVWFVSFEKM
jgi:hypothetical protein